MTTNPQDLPYGCNSRNSAAIGLTGWATLGLVIILVVALLLFHSIAVPYFLASFPSADASPASVGGVSVLSLNGDRSC